MKKRGRKSIRSSDQKNVLIKRNYYIEVRYTKALTILSALTGKELSFLVNEALEDLIAKYQPKTNIDLLNLETIDEIN